MHRRTFLQSIGMAGAVTGMPGSAAHQAAAQPHSAGTPKTSSNLNTWLFWDLWHLDRRENVALRQGQPEWISDATSTHELAGWDSWPTVYYDTDSGRWRMLYSAGWSPHQMMIAESDDGIHFRPLPQPEISVEGGKIAPNHLFTLERGSCGSVFIDPIAADGFRFKAYGHQIGKPVFRRALTNPNHRWHEAAKQAGHATNYMVDELMLVSPDGLHWECRYDYQWGLPNWHPEPPTFGYYNHHLDLHMQTVRPGWGDRRVCLQSTRNFRDWSGPQLLLQPDPLDQDLCEHYGMPVFPYENSYVGLLWMFHAEQAQPTTRFNRSIAAMDVQLAYSYDGVRFQRGLREPFVPMNPPGQLGCSGIESSCLVDADDEIRIYSAASKIPHGQSGNGQAGIDSILVHRLRKDGFMYLESTGHWASFVSKPLVLFTKDLTMNAAAPFGDVIYQLTNIASEPLEGFTFDTCQPLTGEDALAKRLQWNGNSMDHLVGKIVRLEVKFRFARIYAVRGNFHFIDAQDWHLIRDGQSIDPAMFNF